MEFFTSDTHFGHKSIIDLCNRPFSSVEEMNEKLIENWNKVVGKDDVVYHLGDFAFGGSQLWNDILSKLNGQIHLIMGNHDFKNIRKGYYDLFASISQQKYIQIEDKSIYLNHYPFLCYGGTYRKEQNVWQLFGHIHSSPGCDNPDFRRLSVLFPTQYDVGIDNNNFTPVSWNQIKEIINKQIEYGKI